MESRTGHGLKRTVISPFGSRCSDTQKARRRKKRSKKDGHGVLSGRTKEQAWAGAKRLRRVKKGGKMQLRQAMRMEEAGGVRITGTSAASIFCSCSCLLLLLRSLQVE